MPWWNAVPCAPQPGEQCPGGRWAQKQLQTLFCLSANSCLNCCEHSWAQLASKVLFCAASPITGNGKGVDTRFCSLCTASWQDGFWFSCFSPCCLNIYQWTCPFCILESKLHNTRNILGVAQCCRYLWDLLVGFLLASPQFLAFSPLVFPQESSMCQALTWEPDLRRTCPIYAGQCSRKTSVRHVMQDKVICESAYLRWIQFLILEGAQAQESCVHTHLSSLQSTRWATGCCRDPVSWMLSGGALRLPAPPHPPLITNNNQIPLFACSI